MSPHGAKLFSSVFIIVGAAVLFFGIRSVLQAHASSGWPTTTGKVISSSVDSERSDKGGTTYHAAVLYEFNVSGVVHSADDVAYGQYGSSDPSYARGLVNKYPAGREVTVYYSPNNADDCVLEPGISGKAFFLPAFGAVFFTVGVVMFIYLPRLDVRKMMHHTIIASAVFAVSGCGSYSLPLATSRPVSPDDLVGEWRYCPYAPGNPKVVLKLSPESVFTQIVRVDGDTMTQSGTWALRGVDLVLSDVLTEFNGWRPAQQAWRIIDRSNAPKGFAILGGGNDPDQWVVFEANRELSDAADSR